MKRWICILMCLLAFAPNAYAREVSTVDNPERIFEATALSYDYGVLSNLGKVYYDTWVLRYDEDLLEGIYLVGKEHQESVLENWSRMREYWLRVETHPICSSVDVKSYGFFMENGDDIRIWCSIVGGDIAFVNGGYGDSPPQPAYDVVYLMVDPMGQTDEEILERLKAMKLGCEVTYQTADGQKHTEEITVNMEGLHREILNEEEGVSFVVETCEIRRQETNYIYGFYLPEEMRGDAAENPEKYARLILSVKTNKNMPFAVYKLRLGAFEDQELWCESIPGSGDFSWTSDMLFLAYAVENREYNFTIGCVVKLEELTEAAVLKKLQESSLSAYYSTEGVGNLFSEGEGIFRFGPVFKKKLDFSSVACFLADW